MITNITEVEIINLFKLRTYMEKLNRYGIVSWWHIFDILDQYAHAKAEDCLWKCVTASANIQYLNKIKPDEVSVIEIETIFMEQRWYTIYVSVEAYVQNLHDTECKAVANFLFVKI